MSAIVERDEKLFRRGLLAICESLHLHNTGADGGFWGDENEPNPADAVEYLRSRLASWDARSGEKHIAYDDAVRALVSETIRECYAVGYCSPDASVQP